MANCWFNPRPSKTLKTRCHEKHFENHGSISQNAFAARARPRAPLKKLTALPHRAVFKEKGVIGPKPLPKMSEICCHKMRLGAVNAFAAGVLLYCPGSAGGACSVPPVPEVVWRQ